MLDIFNDDAFSLQSLTLAIEKLPYVPGRLGALNIFQSQPLTTQTLLIEEKSGRISILPTMPRGSQNQTTQVDGRRKLRSLIVPHVPQWDSILAADLEGKRAFGSEDSLEVYSQIVNDRLERMKANHELTWEYHRVGALHGIILDADGSTIYNLFTEFGITQLEVEFDFEDTGDYDQAEPTMNMKLAAQAVKRAMQKALGNTPFKGIRAMCGDGFFDSFVQHATVRKAYEAYQQNEFARSLQGDEGGFVFAGITWENYRGEVDEEPFFANDEAIFYPEGVRDIFVQATAPADFVETVNTRGKDLYSKQELMKWGKGVELHTQSNTLFLCTRPRCLIKGSGTNLVDPVTVS